MSKNVTKFSTPLRLGLSTVDPVETENGVIYYNTTDEKFLAFENGTWEQFSSRSYVDAVTASLASSLASSLALESAAVQDSLQLEVAAREQAIQVEVAAREQALASLHGIVADESEKLSTEIIARESLQLELDTLRDQVSNLDLDVGIGDTITGANPQGLLFVDHNGLLAQSGDMVLNGGKLQVPALELLGSNLLILGGNWSHYGYTTIGGGGWGLAMSFPLIVRSMVIEYSMKDSVTNAIRTGTLMLAHDGMQVSMVDTYVETAELGVVLSATRGSALNIEYDSFGNNLTMQYKVSKYNA